MQIDVLDKGFIRLDACDATDLSVVNAARVSFGAKSEELSEKDKGLIGFLMREKHGTPFEHNFFRFHIKAPIFVVREWFRHRIGWSYNEYSGRYSEMPEEAYMPEQGQMRTQVGKPGAYKFEPMEDWEADENAQWEIRQYANGLEKIFEEQMPTTYDHFVYNGFVAP